MTSTLGHQERKSRRNWSFGFLINPIAGMGGKPGLKGTDGEGTAEAARRLGAEPIAPMRAQRALARLVPNLRGVELVTGRGALGESIARDLRLEPRLVGPPVGDNTTAQHTREVAAEMRDAGVDLILFAGGDGTARDIVDVIGASVPLLGVPSGVKMHSGVFATSPETAGDVAASFLARQQGQAQLREAEIMDADEAELRAGRVSARLYGYARVPYERLRVQHAKAGGTSDDEAALDALCQKLARSLEAGCLYLFGPGTTTHRIVCHAGIPGTLLGIDAVLDGRPIGADIGETSILALSEGRRMRVILGVVGGQGCLFGRGNQQISAEVVRRAEGITIVSSLAKLLALEGQSLFADGDEALHALLPDYMRVETGPDQSVICRLRKG
jgi:predicted polyphosphate/ATP-dependent NAD kinase